MLQRSVIYKSDVTYHLNEIKHFHYFTKMTTPKHNKPYPGNMKIYNSGIPFLGHLADIFTI